MKIGLMNQQENIWCWNVNKGKMQDDNNTCCRHESKEPLSKHHKEKCFSCGTGKLISQKLFLSMHVKLIVGLELHRHSCKGAGGRLSPVC